MSHKRRSLIVLGLAVLACAVPAMGDAQDDASTLERKVKAAFLYKFAGYVEWPEGAFPRPDTPITVGVMGDPQLAEELSQVVANRSVEGRPMAVRKLREGEPLNGLHMVFVGRGEESRIPQIARLAQPRAVLLVTESEGALAQGSIINFVMSGGRVKFEIALDGAERRGFKLSSRLITVAQNFKGGASQ